MERDELISRSNALSNRIIGAAIEVHRQTGPGLLESAYEACLCRELDLAHISFTRQAPVALDYKGLSLECGYRLDILVGGLVIVEIKSVEKLQIIHTLQLTTYLKLTDLWLGLLINFNEATVRDGTKRVVNG